MTGSGKTYAFLLPILHQLMEKPRGRHPRARADAHPRAGAQILERHLEGARGPHARHRRRGFRRRRHGAPQEHAFRSGVDIIIATPGRLLDHFRQPYAKLDHLEFLVLDEADRMLDMGFLPDIKPRSCGTCPEKAPDAVLQRDDAGADRLAVA
jgi:ATP-dependent RNA helicase RhlE